MTRATPRTIIKGHRLVERDQDNVMELPVCAMMGERRTVIVRILDTCDACSRHGCSCCPLLPSGQARVTHSASPRTSLYCRSSDCDSDVLKQRRQYRASAARSRYANAWSAICVLLLVGSLPPETSAAPTRKMSFNASFWENPCDYPDPTVKSKQEYSPALAGMVATEATGALNLMTSYQDEFANKTHDIQSYKVLLSYWDTYDWFRGLPWFEEVMLPRETARGTVVDKLVASDEQLDIALPKLYRGLQMALASFQEMSKHYVSEYYADLPKSLKETSHKIRYMLCLFYDVMVARDLIDKVDPINVSEIPRFVSGDLEREALLVFRDSLYYVEHLSVLFSKMAEKEAPSTASPNVH